MGNASRGLAADSIRRLRDTLTTLSSAPNALHSMQEVCDALYDLLDCNFVEMSIVEQNVMRLVAYSGEPGRRLVGNTTPVDTWCRLLEESEGWGQLRFCRDPRPFFDMVLPEDPNDPTSLLGDELHWGSLNKLVAPLQSADGILVGVVCLDASAGTELPHELMCTVVELFTAQAGIFIYQQRLRERVAADHVALQLSEERFRLAFDNAPVGMAEFSQVNDNLVLTRVNRAAATILGVQQLESRNRPVDDVIAVAEGEPLSQQLLRLLRDDRRLLRLEMRLLRPDGSRFWGLLQVAPLPDVAGRAGLLCQLTDITEDKSRALKLTQQARRDPLTSLPNRVVVLDRLEAAVVAAGSDRRTGSVLFCDLDNFKQVNDEQGHLVGDEVLAELAGRLDRVVRKTDTVGRFGGDEFVIVAYPLTLQEAAELSKRVQEVLSEPMMMSGVALRVRVSIGIADITGDESAPEVLRRADEDMYAMRRSSIRWRQGSATDIP